MTKSIQILFLGLVCNALLISCQIATERDFSLDKAERNDSSSDHHKELQNIKPRLDSRYNLTEDRDQFEILRSQTPEEIKVSNDEKALLLSWMEDYKKEPYEVREKYNNLVRKKRDKFNSDMQKIREEYSKQEKKRRDNFLNNIDNERLDIKERKLNREKSSELYVEIDNRRKEYFSKERDLREEFESEFRQKRKDFEEYLKEKMDNFNFEMKVYTEKFNNLKKQQQN
ncbi:MAG: hypothetical protein ACK4VO_02490 [Pseudobdellovibrio sp.]